MPVLPEVGSRIVQPGRSVPSFSATSTIFSAARSLMDPVGFWSSSFAQRRTSADGDSRGRPTSGVPPTEPSVEAKRTGGSAAGDGWEHDDLVAVADRGVEAAGEADVLVVDVDVDEAAQVALPLLGLDEPFLDAGVVGLEVVDHLGQRCTLPVDGLLTVGVRAQDGRDTDLDCHQSLLLGSRDGTTATSSSVTSPLTILYDLNSTGPSLFPCSRVLTST